MEKQTPILITLTSPTAAGKSYLFNYIRDVAKLPCLISTTTRRPRVGEEEGVDYFFISKEESNRIEAEDGFAELAIYRGIRYGVTKAEYHNKLAQGLAFLIVEPTGLEHYAKPALDSGAKWLKYYVHTDVEVRMERFYERMMQDIGDDIRNDIRNGYIDSWNFDSSSRSAKTIKSYFDRHTAMLTSEVNWGTATDWTRIIFGTDDPKHNLEIILKDVEKCRERYAI